MPANSGAPRAIRTSRTITTAPARAARCARSRRQSCRAPSAGADAVASTPASAAVSASTVTGSLHRDLRDVQHTGPVADHDVLDVLAEQPLVDGVVERHGQRLLADLLVQRAPAGGRLLQIGDLVDGVDLRVDGRVVQLRAVEVATVGDDLPAVEDRAEERTAGRPVRAPAGEEEAG